MTETHDVVVVGAGIGGAALATVLARNGLDVLLLERQTAYRDKVRGEWMAPWGVAELQDPSLVAPLMTPIVGPEMVPAEAFAPETLGRLLTLN